MVGARRLCLRERAAKNAGCEEDVAIGKEEVFGRRVVARALRAARAIACVLPSHPGGSC